MPTYFTKAAAGLLLTLAASLHVFAEDVTPEQIEAQLQALEAELEEYRQLLEQTEGQKSEIEKALEQNEKSISETLKQIDALEKDINQNRDKISSLTEQQQELQDAKVQQQDLIAQQVRAAYEMGHQEYLKVLLNQEDPAELDRMLTYYDYLNRARAEQVMTFNQTLVELDQVSAELTRRMNLLAQSRERLESERQALNQFQEAKQRSLTALIAQIRSTGTEISRIEEDRERLEDLLDRISTSIAGMKVPGNAEPFSNMRGKLVLPVAGKIGHKFGHRRNQGKMRWQGVVIDADAGDPVHAVHYGRVVFSDWLRGFGLLMIVNHGEGYMSLYGHNQALYRETGDWVAAGEVIATVGDSGGQNSHGLYFEIRIDGKPSDPQQWCVARDARTA